MNSIIYSPLHKCLSFQICTSAGLPYMPFRFWVGVWSMLITTLMVALEGNFLVRYFTRFVEDIFSILISLIFIMETLVKLIKVSRTPLANWMLKSACGKMIATSLYHNASRFSSTTHCWIFMMLWKNQSWTSISLLSPSMLHTQRMRAPKETGIQSQTQHSSRLCCVWEHSW